jgi:adenylate cyclase
LDLYRNYTRDPNMLAQAEANIKRALEIQPDLWSAYSSLSVLYRLQGKLQEAEDAAKECVRRRPDLGSSHFALAFHYTNINKPAEAITSYARSIELRPDDLTTQFNIVIAAVQLGDATQVLKWSNAALPLYERRLRLAPDDEHLRVRFANLLRYAGLTDRAVSVLAPLLDKHNLDGNTLFNIACLYAGLDDLEHAMESLRRSVAAGYRNIEQFRIDNDLDPLRELPEFKDLMGELESSYA